MLVIGCDFHPSWQQVCWVDTITGETEEKKLVHGSGEAERFYRQLSGPALIGMESTGNHQWFLEMVTAAGHELWEMRRRFGPAMCGNRNTTGETRLCC